MVSRLDRAVLLLAGGLWLASGFLLVAESPAGSFDPGRYLDHIKFLASERLRGRATGSAELDRAARYIARHFRSAGLEPVAGGDYFQKFDVTTDARLGPGNRFSWTLDGVREKLTLDRDFIPLNFSTAGRFSGGVVFAGYGITAREYEYDDYTGVDARGKFVIVLRHEPQEFDQRSIFAGQIYTEHAQLFSKALNARLHGAKGLLYVNDIASHGGGSGELEKFIGTAGPGDAGIPFVHVSAGVVDRWLDAVGKKLSDVQSAIDRDLRPRSFALPGSLEVSVNVDVERRLRKVRNVAGYLPGRTAEHVIIGAHYDHIGLGEQFSMAPAMAGTPHPGADDNASGTAGLLELARWFSARSPLERGILFLGFAGEELGLLGSSHYAHHPLLPVEKAVAMVNMDMIGRVRERRVYVGGVATGSTFRAVLEAHAQRADLDVDLTDTTGYGSSDHTSFTTREVPVLFFFSGLHGDYHRPSDTWDKIDAPGTTVLLQFIADVVTELASGNSRPRFVHAVHGGGAAGEPSAP